MLSILLQATQANLPNATPQADGITLSSNALTVISLIVGLISVILGTIAIWQAYHYNKLTSQTFTAVQGLLAEMKTSVTKAETAATKVETISQVLNDKFFSLFEKTMTQVTRGALNPKTTLGDNLKKDLEKTITDSSEKMSGEIKGLTDSMDKNHSHISEIKSSLKVVADAIQEIFNKAIDHIDDYEEGQDEFEYVKKKICEKCSDKSATFKDLLNNTSSKISVTKKIGFIQKLKEDKVVNYEGTELYDHTQVFVEKNLDVH